MKADSPFMALLSQRLRSVRRGALVGLLGGAFLFLLGFVFSYVLSAVGVLLSAVIGMVLIVDRARGSRRWASVWWASVALILGAAAVVVYGNLWAIEFDLADADKPIPAPLEFSSRGSVLVAFAGAAVFLALSLRALPRRAKTA